jgi:hypothetical protein
MRIYYFTIIITLVLVGTAVGSRLGEERKMVVTLNKDCSKQAETDPDPKLEGNHGTMTVSINDPNELDDPLSKRRAAACTVFSGFVFWPSYDSSGSDIGRYDPKTVSITSMLDACSKNVNCKGLNTNGYYKSTITPLRLWYQPAEFTSDPCKGLYIKSATTFAVNSHALSANEINRIKWIAQWTVPNFGMSRYDAIKSYLGVGTWWSLKEGVLNLTNPWNHSLCQGKSTPLGPLETCTAATWQVGIAGTQVPNWRSKQSSVTQRATSVYKTNDIPTILGKSAQQAGYASGSATYNSIIASTGDLRLSWLLKAHLVGFYMGALDVNWGCVNQSPLSWCYNSSWEPSKWYSPDKAGVQKRIDEVMVLLQSLTNGV